MSYYARNPFEHFHRYLRLSLLFPVTETIRKTNIRQGSNTQILDVLMPTGKEG